MRQSPGKVRDKKPRLGRSRGFSLTIPGSRLGRIAGVCRQDKASGLLVPVTIIQLPQEAGVDCDIDYDYKSSHANLQGSGQIIWINYRQKIMLDKSSLITGFTSSLTERQLQRCQWAQPSVEFQQHGPCYSRQMQYCRPAPSENQQSTCYHEYHERKMQHDNGICSQFVEHELIPECSLALMVSVFQTSRCEGGIWHTTG